MIEEEYKKMIGSDKNLKREWNTFFNKQKRIYVFETNKPLDPFEYKIINEMINGKKAEEIEYPKIVRPQGGGSQKRHLPDYPDDLIIICNQNFKNVVPYSFRHRAWFIPNEEKEEEGINEDDEMEEEEGMDEEKKWKKRKE